MSDPWMCVCVCVCAYVYALLPKINYWWCLMLMIMTQSASLRERARNDTRRLHVYVTLGRRRRESTLWNVTQFKDYGSDVDVQQVSNTAPGHGAFHAHSGRRHPGTAVAIPRYRNAVQRTAIFANTTPVQNRTAKIPYVYGLYDEIRNVLNSLIQNK